MGGWGGGGGEEWGGAGSVIDEGAACMWGVRTWCVRALRALRACARVRAACLCVRVRALRGCVRTSCPRPRSTPWAAAGTCPRACNGSAETAGKVASKGGGSVCMGPTGSTLRLCGGAASPCAHSCVHMHGLKGARPAPPAVHAHHSTNPASPLQALYATPIARTLPKVSNVPRPPSPPLPDLEAHGQLRRCDVDIRVVARGARHLGGPRRAVPAPCSCFKASAR